MPRLFRKIQDAIDRKVARLVVTYGPRGVPRLVFVDSDTRIADEEIGYIVRGFAPLQALASKTSPGTSSSPAGASGASTPPAPSRPLCPRTARGSRLVNDVNFMLYTPLLPGAAAGVLEPRHVTVPLREQLPPGVDLRLGRITGATPERNVLQVESARGPRSRICPTTKLVVNVGSVSRDAADPGARRARAAASSPSLRRSRCATTSCAGWSTPRRSRTAPRARGSSRTSSSARATLAWEGLAELQDFVADILDLYPRCRVHGVRWILVEAGGRASCRRSPEKLADVRREASCAAAASRSARRRRSTRVTEHHAYPLRRRAGADAHPSSGRRASSRSRSSRSSGCRSTDRGRIVRRQIRTVARPRERLGDRRLPPRCRTRRARASPALRPRSTRSARGEPSPTTSRRR